MSILEITTTENILTRFAYPIRIVPVLIKGMVYTPDDIIELTGMEDTTVPDKEEDLKPRHHKAQTHSQKHDAPAGPHGNATNGAGEDDDDSDFDDDEDEEDTYSKWSLRKCSAAALDVIATVFGDELLVHLLPKLKEQLFHQDWAHRECGILALGAIAEGSSCFGSGFYDGRHIAWWLITLFGTGCPVGMYPHLPQLIPHLIETLKDPQVR